MSSTTTLLLAGEADSLGAIIHELDLIVNDTDYDRAHDVIYASVHSSSPSHAGTVVAVDPASGEVISEHQVGPQPVQIAVSPTGDSLYVGFDDTSTVTKFALPNFTEVWTFPLGVGASVEPLAAGDIAVSPAGPDTIAIALRSTVGWPDHAGVVVVDGGTARPDRAQPSIAGDQVGFNGSGTELYATDSESSPPAFYRYSIGASGVTGYEQIELASSGKPIWYRDRVYVSRGGQVVDVDGPSTIVEPLIGGLLTIDEAAGVVYSLGRQVERDNLQVSSFDVETGERLRQWQLDLVTDFVDQVLWVGDERLSYVEHSGRPFGTLNLVDLTPDYGSLGEYTPLTPDRILDTRTGLGRNGLVARLGAGQTIDVQVAGAGGVPASGATTVVLNVAVVAPTQPGFLTVFPTGLARPTISSLNFMGGNTVANLVTMPMGTDGKVSVYNPFGELDVLFDVAGFYTSVIGPDGSRFHSLTPSRAMDTRDGTGGWTGTIPGGQAVRLQLGGTGQVPSGASAVALNVTVTGPTAHSFVTVFPTDVAQPTVSNLNFGPGATLANQVIVRLPADGSVNVFNANGAAHVIVDVVGYYDDVEDGERGRFIPLAPFRDIDTREDSPFPPPGNIWEGELLYYGAPDETASAYVMNVTVTETEGFGFVTAFPYADESSTVPLASTLNYSPGRTVPNHAIVATGPYVGFYNAGGRVHLIVDFFGYFT